MKRLSRYFLATLAVAILALVLRAPLSASAATQTVSVSPTSVDKSVNAGDTFSGSLLVYYKSEDTKPKFKVYATPYHVKGENYDPSFTPLPHAPNPASWVTFPSGSEASGGDVQKIPYSVTVPAGTPQGDYYLTVFAETLSPSGSGGVVLHERVGVIFYITVGGVKTSKGKIDSWTVKAFQRAPVNGVLRIENDGSTHFAANTIVSLQDIFGNTKLTMQSEKQVLPQTIRQIALKAKQTPSFGLFKLNGTVTYLGKTQKLPQHYVLIMSSAIQRTLLIGAGVLVLLGGAYANGRRAVRRRAKASETSDTKKPKAKKVKNSKAK